MVNALTSGFSLGNFTIRNVEIVGPKVGASCAARRFSRRSMRCSACWFILHFALSGCTVLRR